MNTAIDELVAETKDDIWIRSRDIVIEYDKSSNKVSQNFYLIGKRKPRLCISIQVFAFRE